MPANSSQRGNHRHFPYFGTEQDECVLFIPLPTCPYYVLGQDCHTGRLEKGDELHLRSKREDAPGPKISSFHILLLHAKTLKTVKMKIFGFAALWQIDLTPFDFSDQVAEAVCNVLTTSKLSRKEFCF